MTRSAGRAEAFSNMTRSNIEYEHGAIVQDQELEAFFELAPVGLPVEVQYQICKNLVNNYCIDAAQDQGGQNLHFTTSCSAYIHHIASSVQPFKHLHEETVKYLLQNIPVVQHIPFVCDELALNTDIPAIAHGFDLPLVSSLNQHVKHLVLVVEIPSLSRFLEINIANCITSFSFNLAVLLAGFKLLNIETALKALQSVTVSIRTSRLPAVYERCVIREVIVAIRAMKLRRGRVHREPPQLGGEWVGQIEMESLYGNEVGYDMTGDGANDIASLMTLNEEEWVAWV